MKTRNTISKLITITMAVAAIAVIGSIGAAGQVINGATYSIDVPTIGFIHGQSLRCSVANTRTQEEGGEPVQVRAYIYDMHGNLLRQTDPIEVPPRQSRAIVVNRDDLLVAGEAGTGRVQMQPAFQFQSRASEPFSHEGILFSLELVDNLTGGTISYKGGALGLAPWWSSGPLNPAPAPKRNI